MPAPDPKRQRLAVLKTYKLYIGGKFPRTESGRYKVALSPKTGEHLANYCHASRKDFRDAVVAARKAQPGWAGNSAYLKGQILYRAAEMLESRADSLVAELQDSTDTDKRSARAEVEASVDRLVYYAGWSDKFQQVFGSVNPVASSHFNFSTPEPTGIVGIFCPDSPSLLGLVSLVAPVILGGNSVVVLASEKFPLPAITLAEIISTSDIPGGVINLLTGERTELAPHFATHMDINAIVDGSGDTNTESIFRGGSATNLKRVAIRAQKKPTDWFGGAAQDPYRILDTVEFKTAWHPIGI
ncbi:MAG: acyl-CoA reductase-like NAD-dependent aldehyde dehydrogenase [Verrucomicrobiales bacterium]|jgi:acyl-CoA reductase-like NAD-dependent aldehyde dehydrogenase